MTVPRPQSTLSCRDHLLAGHRKCRTMPRRRPISEAAQREIAAAEAV